MHPDTFFMRSHFNEAWGRPKRCCWLHAQSTLTAVAAAVAAVAAVAVESPRAFVVAVVDRSVDWPEPS